MSSEYVTASRKNILEYLKKNTDKTVTVSDISLYLEEANCDVNVTTIYRYLEKLVREEKVIKYVAEKGRQAAFQYVEQGHGCMEHLHLKCTGCGNIIHLECDFMSEIAAHIKKEYCFSIQCRNSIIYGLCGECEKVSGIWGNMK